MVLAKNFIKLRLKNEHNSLYTEMLMKKEEKAPFAILAATEYPHRKNYQRTANFSQEKAMLSMSMREDCNKVEASTDSQSKQSLQH